MGDTEEKNLVLYIHLLILYNTFSFSNDYIIYTVFKFGYTVQLLVCRTVWNIWNFKYTVLFIRYMIY